MMLLNMKSNYAGRNAMHGRASFGKISRIGRLRHRRMTWPNADRAAADMPFLVVARSGPVERQAGGVSRYSIRSLT